MGEYLNELDAARRAANSQGRTADVSETLDSWESLDLEERRAFLAEHIVRIIVEDDKVEVVV